MYTDLSQVFLCLPCTYCSHIICTMQLKPPKIVVSPGMPSGLTKFLISCISNPQQLLKVVIAKLWVLFHIHMSWSNSQQFKRQTDITWTYVLQGMQLKIQPHAEDWLEMRWSVMLKYKNFGEVSLCNNRQLPLSGLIPSIAWVLAVLIDINPITNCNHPFVISFCYSHYLLMDT